MSNDDSIDWTVPAAGLDAVTADLHALRAADGTPSYAEISRRIDRARAARGARGQVARSTVYDCFRAGRRRLDTEIVVEIGRALGLSDEAVGRWTTRVRAARAAADGADVAPSVHTAPEPVAYFVGRRSELGTLATVAREPGRWWVTGMPGIGKTQLLLRLAEALGPAAVYVDLRAHAAAPPVDPATAQRAILRELGAPQSLEPSAARRGAQITDLLREAGRVLLLDDAADQASVDAIGVTERVVVTSRRRRDDDGWSPLELGGLDAQETGLLLRAMTGNEGGPPAEPDQIARLTDVTEGLPLGLALVGGRLRTHPDWTLADHVDLIERRIDDGVLEPELRTSIRLSTDDLSAPAYRLLRLLADAPVADADLDELAALTGAAPIHAADAVRELLDHHLLHRRGTRVGMHALVRAFARERAADLDPPHIRADAFRRLGVHVAEGVWAAYETVVTEQHGATTRTTSFTWASRPWDAHTASEWMRSNLPSILAIAFAAPERGCPELLYRISEGASIWLNLTGRVEEGLRLHTAAADTAAERQDPEALAMASLDAGQLLVSQRRPEEALGHFTRATSLAGHDALTDPGLTGVLLNMSATVRARSGSTTAALADLAAAIELHDRLGEDARLLSALLNRGHILHSLGRFAEEREHLDRLVDRAERTGNLLILSLGLTNLAGNALATGDAASAVEQADRAERLADEVDAADAALEASTTRADALRALGRRADASVCIAAALDRAQAHGSTMPSSRAHLVDAETAVEDGDPDRAARALRDAEACLDPDTDFHLWARYWRVRAALATDEHERRGALRDAGFADLRAGRAGPPPTPGVADDESVGPEPAVPGPTGRVEPAGR